MNRFLVSYFFCIFFFFTFFASGIVDSQDGLQYLTIARRLYYDHTAEMPNANWDDNTNLYMNTQKSKEGKLYAPTGLGYTLALLPAVMIEDYVHQLLGIVPISAFPLQNDWPVILLASMTNSFFGALLVTTLYLYFRQFAVGHYFAMSLSFFLFISSNLFIYTKHSFAHIMFTTALTIAFYFIKRYGLTERRLYLAAAGVSYGVVVISYNQTYLLPLLPLALYFLLQKGWEKILPNKKNAVKVLKDIAAGLVGASPFLLLYFLFNALRFGGAGVSVEANQSLPDIDAPKFFILFEGIWGLLLSPGKSIFLFTPVLFLILLFWFKLPKKSYPELLAFGFLSILYIYFIGSYEGADAFPLWHGESSFGPRYMLPIVPLGLLLAGIAITKMTKLQRCLVALPLIGLGLGVQAVGIMLPYQIRFWQLPDYVWVGEDRLHVTRFANIIPRYSPVFNMTKVLYKRMKKIKTIYSHGQYNVRLFDGFERPMDLGYMVWREPHGLARFSFENTDPQVNKISLQFRNHQIEQTSSISAQLRFALNGKELTDSEYKLPVHEEKEIILQLPENGIKLGTNTIEIRKEFLVEPPSQLKKKQVIFLQILRINDSPQPISTIDYPYVSPVSRSLIGSSYGYYGGEQSDPWEIWHMRSGVYEWTFDFWWLRPYHYWDLPKDFFLVLGLLNGVGLVYAGWYTFRFRE